MKLVTVPEMHSVEQEADAHGLTYTLMMENAGLHLAEEAIKLSYSYENEEESTQVLGLVGPGNNGGDTLVALAHLAKKGWKTSAYLVHRKTSGDALIKRLEEAGGEISSSDKDSDYKQLRLLVESTDVLLDGVLGTGFKPPLKDEIGKVMGEVKEITHTMEWPPFVIAVDCPSGIDCYTGEAVGQTIPADVTVTMAAVKQGLLKLPAHDLAGEIRVVDIGDLNSLKSWQSLRNDVADEELVSSLLPERPSDAHKGTFGTVMIASGSTNYTGAVLLAGKAAYRSGAGLVTLAIPAPLHTALAGHFPEATWVLLPHEMGVIASGAVEILSKNLERVTALLIGPGLGVEETTGNFLSSLLNGNQDTPVHGRMGFVKSTTEKEGTDHTSLPPLVIDADGLKLLARIPNWHKLLPGESILTPHPGEMSVLTGLSIDEIQKDRLVVALKYAKTWGHVVVLKGAFTVIASPDEWTTTIPVATPALARAGTGDVLAGLITGFRAQGLKAYDAARAGAWIHAEAGLYAAQYQGSTGAVMAGDVLDALPEVLSGLD
jgi:ADP-dependent NAD(P)H-hydrate dehydratase / NAD(P)H-hydrate epimerase